MGLDCSNLGFFFYYHWRTETLQWCNARSTRSQNTMGQQPDFLSPSPGNQLPLQPLCIEQALEIHTLMFAQKKKKKSKWSVFLLASFQSLLFFVQMAKLFRDSISKDYSDFSCSSFLGMAGNEKATSLESRFHGKGITRLEYRVKVTMPKNENN